MFVNMTNLILQVSIFFVNPKLTSNVVIIIIRGLICFLLSLIEVKYDSFKFRLFNTTIKSI